MDPSIAELNQKIDALTDQVRYLAEQARIAERARQEREELLHDLMPVANDAMRIATEHLQEVESCVNPADLIRLLKKLARAAPYIEQALDQLDGVKDLIDVAMPLSKDMFGKAERALDVADRKGYFVFMRGGMQIVDNIVTSFSEEDIRQFDGDFSRHDRLCHKADEGQDEGPGRATGQRIHSNAGGRRRQTVRLQDVGRYDGPEERGFCRWRDRHRHSRRLHGYDRRRADYLYPAVFFGRRWMSLHRHPAPVAHFTLPRQRQLRIRARV